MKLFLHEVICLGSVCWARGDPVSVGLEVNCCSRSERWLGACAVRGDSAFVRRGVNGCLSGERWPGGWTGGRWLCVLLGGEVARCLFGERWLGVCGVRGDLVFVR